MVISGTEILVDNELNKLKKEEQGTLEVSGAGSLELYPEDRLVSERR